ncbi:DUF4917 family protein [Klebsiella oxytoca]|uniref:DUF4917 family protein n=1 Tax=Klebsiella oxytoca TaxID=571 RepID=UPI001F2FDB5F|nr:DUF4917 family protein [Klebsiella oxytoca]MCW9606570.1 DUF4917 family protein [Klebsiella oxytoca]MCW9673769.1 DUF4917 family protein [Klebsiella oxytoca]
MQEGEKPSLLMGNGFSQAWSPQIFNYRNILDNANFGAHGDLIRKLFQELNTFDFESVMDKLSSANRIIKHYDPHCEMINLINEHQEALKTALINAISNSHPTYPHQISGRQFSSARSFLSCFEGLFTLNYDLLMYWARNKNSLEPLNFETDDGFRAGRTWQRYDTDQEVFFLHGALHLYEQGSLIKKHASSDNGNTIIEQVQINLDEDAFPLFVSEPTSEKKKERILHNPYLNFCYAALRRLKGTLFIYGHSMDKNDRHIFDQIRESQITKVYVSIYGNENDENNKKAIANAYRFLSKDGYNVVFFIAETAPIWGEIQIPA